MTGTDSSSAFTESLLSVIRLQRHLGSKLSFRTYHSPFHHVLGA